MMTKEMYDRLSQQPGFRGIDPIDLPIWAPGYGPGTPTYGQGGGPGSGGGGGLVNGINPKTGTGPFGPRGIGSGSSGPRPAAQSQSYTGPRFGSITTKSQPRGYGYNPNSSQAYTDPRPQLGPLNSGSGFNPNALAGGTFGNQVNPGRQQMVDMMSIMTGKQATPLNSSQYGSGQAFNTAPSRGSLRPVGGSYVSNTGQTFGGFGDYVRAQGGPSIQFAPGTTVATAGSGPVSWGFQSNPLQSFSSMSGFGQPMGGYGSMGGSSYM